MRKKLRLVGLFLLVSSWLVVAEDSAVAAEDRAAGALGSLESVDELAAAFNKAEGVPRLVLLLSPT